MSDIAERLRNRSYRLATRDFNGDGALLAKEAADEIDRLTAALAEARDAALEAAAKVADETHEEAPEDEQLGDEYWSLRVSCNTRSTRIARAIRALKGNT